MIIDWYVVWDSTSYWQYSGHITSEDATTEIQHFFYLKKKYKKTLSLFWTIESIKKRKLYLYFLIQKGILDLLFYAKKITFKVGDNIC